MLSDLACARAGDGVVALLARRPDGESCALRRGTRRRREAARGREPAPHWNDGAARRLGGPCAGAQAPNRKHQFVAGPDQCARSTAAPSGSGCHPGGRRAESRDAAEARGPGRRRPFSACRLQAGSYGRLVGGRLPRRDQLGAREARTRLTSHAPRGQTIDVRSVVKAHRDGDQIRYRPLAGVVFPPIGRGRARPGASAW
jgi:hypothetical protein